MLRKPDREQGEFHKIRILSLFLSFFIISRRETKGNPKHFHLCHESNKEKGSTGCDETFTIGILASSD
jgi:hypothetical protein